MTLHSKHTRKSKFVIVLLITVSLWTSIFSSTVYAQDIDDLIGVWVGTFHGMVTSRAIKVTVYRVDGDFQATILYYSGMNTGTEIIAHYLADVRWNESYNWFELSYIHTYFMPPTWHDTATLRGTIRGDVFSGDFPGGSTFYLNRASRGNFTLLEPHEHLAGDVYRVLLHATCQNAGIRVYSCIFCGAEAAREPIPMLPHIPGGDWYIYVEPTCGIPGRRVQYCENCDIIVLDEEIPRTGNHLFTQHRVSGNIFIPPIVNQEVCEICGFTGRQTVSYAMAWLLPTLIALLLATGITIIIVIVKKNKKSKKFLCPYCFVEHPFYTVLFRCSNMMCVDVDDIQLSAYEGIRVNAADPNTPPLLKRKITFPASSVKNKNVPKFAQCPECGRGTSKIVCPSCHNHLPESTLTGGGGGSY